MLTLTKLIDKAKCYKVVRQFRWPDGVVCPCCGSKSILKRGKDETQQEHLPTTSEMMLYAAMVLPLKFGSPKAPKNH